MGRRPVLVIFCALLLILSFGQFHLDVRSTHLRGFEILQLERERTVRLVSRIAESILATDRLDLLEGHLNDAIRIGWIDFYVLTYKGEVTSFDTLRPLSDDAYATLAALHPPDAFWEFHSETEVPGSIRGPASKEVVGREEFRFFEADLGDQRRLKLGFNVNREAFLQDMEILRKNEDRRIFVLSLLITFAVFLFAARDLLRVAKTIRTKGVRGLKDLRVMSQEAADLQQGLVGFGEAMGDLEKENRKLSAQILPSLRTELQSGKTPPYDFNCTMVRTDINGFTQIFHEHPVDAFLTTINEFFTECSHIVSRYDGYIHEFVGDEIIYYFKDEQHVNSVTAALACAKEISAVAERIHRCTSSERGYPFRIKSSLSYGRIRFGPLLNGFSLAGAPLIETTRILSAVSEKNENTIHFDSSNFVRLHPAVEYAEAFRANLKGMEGERTILRYLGHRPLGDVIAKSALSEVIGDYRSDSDLTKLLLVIAAQPDSPPAKEALRFLNQVQVTKCGPEFTAVLIDVIRSVADVRTIASLVAAIPHLVPPANFDDSLHNLLIELVEHQDSRVVANTIETLQALRDLNPKVSRRLDGRLVDSKNTRVAANALVYLGTTEISRDIVRRVRKLLNSSDVNHVIAGIFAWGEIARHHRETDPVYFKTQTEFRNLLRRFDSLVDRFPTAALHAREAALKAGDPEVSKRFAA